MRTAFRSSLTTLGVLCVMAGSADLATSETSPGEGREKARLTQERASSMTRAAAARISDESRGGVREPAVEAAPRSSATSSVSEQAVQDSSPSPPAGYSFVSYHGEMPRERLQGEVAAGGQRPLMGLDWLGTETSIERLSAQAAAAGRDWSFGWIRLAGDATANDLAQALEGAGARIVGSSGVLVRVRLPGDQARLQAIAALPGGGWAGRPARGEKTRPSGGEPVPRRAPRGSDARVHHPHERRSRRPLAAGARGPGGGGGPLRPEHPGLCGQPAPGLGWRPLPRPISCWPSSPSVSSNPPSTRLFPPWAPMPCDNTTGLPVSSRASAGPSVPVGVMDTGLNINHPDIASNRESVCGANFALSLDLFGFGGGASESEDLWIDEGSHGTAVTGTILGNGFVETPFSPAWRPRFATSVSPRS